ncbi:MAG: hypothetical protein ACFE0Q_01385 [Anaerolineae bacterium]
MRYWLAVISGGLLILLSACNLGTSVPTQTTNTPSNRINEHVVVAWVDAGNLIVWQTGDTLPRRIASGGVVQPFVAPDGEHIVFTRGPQGRAETLWVIDADGLAERELVGERPARYVPGNNQVGDVAWLDERTIYFNTLRQEVPIYTPLNDLYRMDILTREQSLIAVPGEGGRIAISPDSDRVATVYHGTYGRQDGVLRLFDLFGRDDPTNLLFFVGVATGSEFRFYPDLHWLADGSAVLVAIPDPDLVYDGLEDVEVSETDLWRIPVSNPSQRQIIGTVPASFFGLPRWSSDGTALTYLQRVADSNQFTAFLAEGDGANPQAIFGAEAGEIAPPIWLPDSNRFYYTQPVANNDSTAYYWLGAVNAEPQRLSDETIFDLQFISATQYVYITPGNRRLDLRVGEVEGESQFIGSLNTVPIFDAVAVRP